MTWLADIDLIGYIIYIYIYISADPASPWPRQGGAWDHRRCGTLLSLKATVNCTTASDLLWASKTDGCIAPPSNPSGALATASVLLCGSKLTDGCIAPASVLLCGSKLTGAPCPALKHCLWLLPVWFYGISKLTDGPLSRSQSPPRSQDLLRQWFDAISAGTLSGFMGFQWPPAPIPKPSPQPRPPWIQLRMAPCPDPKALPAAETSLDWAAAGFTHAAAMVWWDFGWHPVWFYGFSKLTDGPLSRSQSPPRSRDLLGLSCGWLYPCCGNGLMGFWLAPCLVSWDFKTDGWPPVPIPKPSPQPRPPWIELRLALSMLRQWFDAISAGTLSGFMGFQNWRMAPCPEPPCLVLWDFKTDGWPPVPIPTLRLQRCIWDKFHNTRHDSAMDDVVGI